MNILMINYEYPPLGGGGGVFNKQLAEALSDNNNITVISSQFKNQSPHEVKNNVEIIRVPVFLRGDQNAATIVSMLSFFPFSLWAGEKLLKNKRFDIIHSMFAIPSAPSGLSLKRKFHIPHVLSILGGDIYDPSKRLSPHKTPILHRTVKKMIEGSDSVIALSSDIKGRALKHYSPTTRIDIIHLGIPRPSFIKLSRNHFDFSDEDFLLVTVGRLVQRKGLKDLIKVLQNLNKSNIKLIIIGDGPERATLAEMASSLNVSNQVFFLGRVSDEEKFQLLNAADIYVSSSQHEGFGIVFLEAMATELPVVCYDKGGQTDFLIDKKTGFLVKYGDTHLLMERIKELYGNHTLRKGISRFNAKYIEKFFISSCAEKYQSVYDSLAYKTQKK
jgi:glycosyltransferase involved in cell wall biosynthesis